MSRLSPDVFQTDNVISCEVPGPIKSGGSETVDLTYDVSDLRGGQTDLRWNGIEVYSKSENSDDKNPRNDRSERIFGRSASVLCFATEEHHPQDHSSDHCFTKLCCCSLDGKDH